MIDATDKATLYAMCNTDLVEEYLEITEMEAGQEIQEVQFYFGNEDVRHLIMRDEHPAELVVSLATMLIAKSRTLRKKIKMTSLLPIEDESRTIPQLRRYRKESFHGTQQDRQILVNLFNNVMIDSLDEGKIDDLHFHPNSIYDEDGYLKIEVMEKPQSVHLNPRYYKWDLDENKLRSSYGD